MAIDVATFSATNPVLWHLTTEANLRRLERTRAIESAAALMRAAGDERWLCRRRTSAVQLMIEGEPVWLSDQVSADISNSPLSDI